MLAKAALERAERYRSTDRTTMHKPEPRCTLCGLTRRYECKCTPEALERDANMMRLESARREVAHLERLLGLKHDQGSTEGNRHERRAAKASGRKRRA